MRSSRNPRNVICMLLLEAGYIDRISVTVQYWYFNILLFW